MATTSAPKHLRLLRPFVLSALVFGTGGTLLGYSLLERSQWSLTGAAWPLDQVHAQLQLFGFLIPFVLGFALFLVPRLSGGEPVTHRTAALASLAGFALSALLTAVEPFTRQPVSGVLRSIDGAVLLAATVAAGWTLRAPISRFAASLGGRTQAGYLWFFELAIAALVLAGLVDAIGLWRGAGDPLPLLDERWAQAAWRFALEGFTVGMALGVSARMFTGFLGIPPGRAYPASRSAYKREPGQVFWFGLWVGTWAVSVVLAAIGEVLASPHVIELAELLSAVGLIPLCFRLGLARPEARLQIDRTQDPAFPFGARASYSLLLLAAVVGAAGGLAGLSGHPASPMWIDVRRHLIALGFLMTLIATMAGRLAPGFARSPLAWPALRRTAMFAFVLAALLRCGEGVASQWGFASWLSISAASGPFALIGFAALFTSLAATLIRARSAG